MKALFAILLCGACGFTHGNAQPDTSGDAAARKAPAARVLAGAGHVTTGTITIDVQIGDAVRVAKSTSGTLTISGAPVVQP